MLTKKIFITGASSGLGRATALFFIDKGYTVYAGVRKLKDIEELARKNPLIIPVELDLTSPESIARATKKIKEDCVDEGLSTLINMAGYTFISPIECTADKDIRGLFEVLFFGPTKITNSLLPELKFYFQKNKERAKVINIISWAALDASPFVSFYAAAKSALLRLTQAQFYEFDKINIDSIAIVPGMMKTPFVTTKSEVAINLTLSNLTTMEDNVYGKSLRKMLNMTHKVQNNSILADPEFVAQKIFTIATNKATNYQYNIGFDTKFINFINTIFPFWLLKKIKQKLFGL